MAQGKSPAIQPSLENLDARLLMDAGATASLQRGILSIDATRTSAPVEINIMAWPTRRGLQGNVVIDGVGAFRAAQIKQIVVNENVGENVVVNRVGRWGPQVKVFQTAPAPQPFVPPPAPTDDSPPTPTPSPTPTPTPTPGPTATALLSSLEQSIVDGVNQARAANGLAPLTVNAKLAQAAQIHARDMASFQIMAHDLPGAAQPGLADRAQFVGYNYAAMGENVAYNYSSATSVMNAWMNSSGHRANILNSNFTEIGVGVAYSSNGSPYYCQVFGRPWA